MYMRYTRDMLLMLTNANRSYRWHSPSISTEGNQVEIASQFIQHELCHRFGKRVSYLIARRNEPDVKCSLCHLLSDEMEVNFYVLRPRMEDRVRSEIGGSEVITPQHRWSRLWNSEFSKKVLNPHGLCSTIRECLIFGLCWWSGHCRLLPGAPGNEGRSEK
jgi:hypothetical protein